jgi:UDP:flavonoid glycosyltransferase YjiC (YdhE family)
MNSTMESLAHGVPMVVIPQIEEQRMTAQRIQEMDLGRYLRRSEVNAGSLAKAVNEVFNDAGVKGRARGFQKEIAEAGGPQAAAAWAQSLCQSRLPRRAETYTAVRT